MKTIRPYLFALICAGSVISAASAGDLAAGARAEPTRLEHALTFGTTGCGGAVLQTPQPGAQFASDGAELSPSERSFYQMAAARKVTWLSSMECERTGRSHAQVPAAHDDAKSAVGPLTSTVFYSGNWSGYQLNNTARYVQATYVVPSVSNPTPGYSSSGYYGSVWAGIGGGVGAANPLIQAGTAMQINGTTKSYYHWYEVFGGPSSTNGEVRINSLAAHAGDYVGTVAAWISSTNQAEMGICNLSTGVCVQFYVPNTPAPGASTEWIVEAVRNGNLEPPMPNFGRVSFGNVCWAPTFVPNGTITCGSLAGSKTTIKLQQNRLGGVQIIAEPGPWAANGDFTDYYDQPHEIVPCGRLGYPPCQ